MDQYHSGTFYSDGWIPRPLKRKACLQCTKSKRKCDKTAPECRRCLEKGIACKYPPPRRLLRLPPGTNVGDVLDAQAATGPGAPSSSSTIPSGPANNPTGFVQVLVQEQQLEQWRLELESSANSNSNSNSNSQQPLPHIPTPVVSAWEALPSNSSSSSTATATAPTTTSATEPTTSTSRERPFGGRDPLTDDRWFLLPDSFVRQLNQVPRGPPGCCAPIGEDALPLFISMLQTWQQAWLRTGHSPLSHRQLFRGPGQINDDVMPVCLQDAYASVAAYYHSRDSSQCAKTTTLRIIENRVSQLVNTKSQADLVEGQLGMQDTLSLLARSQALLAYQIVRLFDGDIRTRVQAEQNIDTLRTWTCQLLDNAQMESITSELLTGTRSLETPLTPLDLEIIRLSNSQAPYSATGTASVSGSSTTDSACDNGSILHTQPADNWAWVNAFPPSERINNDASDGSKLYTTWHSWVVAESIRRTYLATSYMHAAYLTLKQGWAVCPGGLAFAAQKGLWDAPSARAWHAKVKEAATSPQGSKLLLLQSLDSWFVVEQHRADEVDDFTKGVLVMNFGIEELEGWSGDSIRDGIVPISLS